jgi:hypothetical protein
MATYMWNASSQEGSGAGRVVISPFSISTPLLLPVMNELCSEFYSVVIDSKYLNPRNVKIVSKIFPFTICPMSICQNFACRNWILNSWKLGGGDY